ncbi:hypothetical protein FVE85_6255 [Porphyridium purpureum]|uniref:CBM20 domain-containing protein n=1 Tax=Porphyridium purpureum TaxID=35688 RepID=A0A5J4Z601_PORPP|nr:hypothetical protein FVE85_6255 [Porphyridium purpureum]|eukprot:POR4758..scf295_1
MGVVTLRATLITSSKDVRLCVVGSCDALGAWRVGDAVPLTPVNESQFEVTVDVEQPAEYKYVLLDKSRPGQFRWEDGGNRKLHPDVGFVSDPLQAWGVKFREWEHHEPGSLNLNDPAYEEGRFLLVPLASGVLPSAYSLTQTTAKQSQGALSAVTVASSGENSPAIFARSGPASAAGVVPEEPLLVVESNDTEPAPSAGPKDGALLPQEATQTSASDVDETPAETQTIQSSRGEPWAGPDVAEPAAGEAKSLDKPTLEEPRVADSSGPIMVGAAAAGAALLILSCFLRSGPKFVANPV